MSPRSREQPLNPYSPAHAKAGAQYRNHPHRIKLMGPRPAQLLRLCAGRSTWVPACAGRSTWVPACAGTGLDERPLNPYSPAPAKAGAQYRNHPHQIKLTGPRPAQPLGLCAGRSTWVPAFAGTGLDERPLNPYSPAPAKAGAQYRNHPR